MSTSAPDDQSTPPTPDDQAAGETGMGTGRGADRPPGGLVSDQVITQLRVTGPERAGNAGCSNPRAVED